MQLYDRTVPGTAGTAAGERAVTNAAGTATDVRAAGKTTTAERDGMAGQPAAGTAVVAE